MTTFHFKFGETFRPDDIVSEWVATLSLAFNDILLASDRLEDDAEIPHLWLYWLRLGISHFAEASKFLDDTKNIPEVEEFVATLPADVREHLDDWSDKYAEVQPQIERLRNLALFHYPELNRRRSHREVQTILLGLTDNYTSAETSEAGMIEGSRLLFADDIASLIVLRAIGGQSNLDAVQTQIREGIDAFIGFTNGVLYAFFTRAIGRGAEWTEEPPGVR